MGENACEDLRIRLGKLALVDVMHVLDPLCGVECFCVPSAVVASRRRAGSRYDFLQTIAAGAYGH